MSGYSQTPLARKLGIKLGAAVALIGAPPNFEAALEGLPADVTVHHELAPRQRFDVLVYFVDRLTQLRADFGTLARHLQPAGGFWVAWPKKASGVPTDLTEDVIRAVGLDIGLVDNKVCAVDETWSGLRFVIRVKDRPKA